MAKKVTMINPTKDELARRLAGYSAREAWDILRAAKHLRKYASLVDETTEEDELADAIAEVEG